MTIDLRPKVFQTLVETEANHPVLACFRVRKSSKVATALHPAGLMTAILCNSLCSFSRLMYRMQPLRPQGSVSEEDRTSCATWLVRFRGIRTSKQDRVEVLALLIASSICSAICCLAKSASAISRYEGRGSGDEILIISGDRDEYEDQQDQEGIMTKEVSHVYSLER